MKHLRIAPNDPVLAHALAKRVMTAERARDDATWESIKMLTGVKPLRRAITRRYGNRFLVENVKRENGSRASAVWTVLDFAGEPGQLWLMDIEFDARAGRTAVVWRGIGVTEHLVARMMQRTIFAATVESLRPLLLAHFALAHIARRNAKTEVGVRVLSFTRDGCIAWDVAEQPEGRTLIGRTWISAGLAVEPIVLAGIARARATDEGACWTVA